MFLFSMLLLSQAPTQPVASHLYELRHSWTSDGLATTAMLSTWAISEFALKSELAPSNCRWCDSNGLDVWGRGLRTNLASQNSVSRLSDVVDFAALPLLTLGTHAWVSSNSQGTRFLGQDVLLIAEATAASMVVTQVVKFSVGRQRPFVSDLSAEESLKLPHPEDNHLSFFSGHTSFAFALVASAGTIATLRNYSKSWLVWTVGLPVAATVPLLRMVADRHYLSDVLIGAAVGGLLGYGIPILFHHRKVLGSSQFQLVPLTNGAALVGVF